MQTVSANCVVTGKMGASITSGYCQNVSDIVSNNHACKLWIPALVPNPALTSALFADVALTAVASILCPVIILVPSLLLFACCREQKCTRSLLSLLAKLDARHHTEVGQPKSAQGGFLTISTIAVFIVVIWFIWVSQFAAIHANVIVQETMIRSPGVLVACVCCNVLQIRW